MRIEEVIEAIHVETGKSCGTLQYNNGDVTKYGIKWTRNVD